MKKNILKDLIYLKKKKKTIKDKIIYILKAFKYYIPIFIEEKSFGVENEDDELLGDDIYPLF